MPRRTTPQCPPPSRPAAPPPLVGRDGGRYRSAGDGDSGSESGTSCGVALRAYRSSSTDGSAPHSRRTSCTDGGSSDDGYDSVASGGWVFPTASSTNVAGSSTRGAGGVDGADDDTHRHRHTRFNFQVTLASLGRQEAPQTTNGGGVTGHDTGSVVNHLPNGFDSDDASQLSLSGQDSASDSAPSSGASSPRSLTSEDRRAHLRDRLLPLLERQGTSGGAVATPINVPIVSAPSTACVRGGVGGAGGVGGGGGGVNRHLPRVVVAGRVHSLLLTAAGEAWAVGSGMFGRLGLGGEGDAEVPTRIPTLAQDNIVAVRVNPC